VRRRREVCGIGIYFRTSAAMNDSWWDTFREKQRLIKEQPPDILAAKQRIQRGLNAKRGVGGALRSLRGRRTLIGDVEKGIELAS
jgi:hypothetical protein